MSLIPLPATFTNQAQLKPESTNSQYNAATGKTIGQYCEGWESRKRRLAAAIWDLRILVTVTSEDTETIVRRHSRLKAKLSMNFYNRTLTKCTQNRVFFKLDQLTFTGDVTWAFGYVLPKEEF